MKTKLTEIARAAKLAKSLVPKSDINSDGAIRAGDISKISASSKTKAMDAYVGLLDQLRRTAAKDGGPTTANVKKAVDTAVKRLKKRDKDGSKALEDAEQKSMTALEARMVQFATSSKGKTVDSFKLPEPYVAKPPRFSWKGTPEQVAVSLLNAYSKPANDNFFPVHANAGEPRASRFVVNAAEAKTMVAALKKLYLSRQEAVLTELAERTHSSSYGCMSPTTTGKKVFEAYAEELGLDLDFQQPAAPAYHQSGGRLLRVSPTEALFPSVFALGAAVRDDREALHLERYWIESARTEMASIPAFLRMARELERVGAPGALRAAALVAAEDEARHTNVCRDRAEAARGRVWTIEELDSPPRIVDLDTLAEEAWLDGCLGEGQAAEALARAAAGARSPEVQRALARIAEDERRHAELAWGVLEWSLREGGSRVRDLLAEARWHGEAHPPEELEGAPAEDARLDHDQLSASGVPTPESVVEAKARVEASARRRLGSLLDRTAEA